MQYDKIREANSPYLKGYEFTQAYYDTKKVLKMGKWFKDPRMIKEWQPFFRTTAGETSTMFVLEVDVRTHKEVKKDNLVVRVDYFMFLDGVPIIQKIQDPLKIRELKLIVGLDFLRKFQINYPEHKFFIQTSGQGYHLIQEAKKYIDPTRFKDVARFLFKSREHGNGWVEEGNHFYKNFTCITTYGKVKYRIFVDKATFKYGMIRWVYSPYWKIKGYEFYSIPVKDTYTINDILEKTKKGNIEIIPYHIPEFVFEDYLTPSDGDEDKIKKSIQRREARVLTKTDFMTIPDTEMNLPYHYKLKLKEMKNLLNSGWKNLAPAIYNAYEKVCRESGHYTLRILLVHALANMGYTPEDIALLFRFHINDEKDNEQPEVLIQQILYYYGDRKNPYPFTYSCNTLQDKDSGYYCCDPTQLCGRINCLKKPIVDDFVDHDAEFKEIYALTENILHNESDHLIELAKTTRSGITTSLIVKGAEMDKRVVALFPTRKIADDTYPEAIEIARQRDSKNIISGAVVRANSSGCKKLIEKIEKFRALRGLHYVSKPSCIEERSCKFWTQIYNTPYIIDGQIIPIGAIASLDPTKCTLATIFQNPYQFDSICLTYAKMRMVLRANKLELMQLKDYFNTADVIILDEFSQFSADVDKMLIKEVKLRWTSNPMIPARRDERNIFKYLSKELFILEHLEQKEVIKQIIEIVRVFIERFKNYNIPAYDKQRAEETGMKIVDNPLSSRQRGMLSQRARTFHAIIEKIAADHGEPLYHIEKLLGFLRHEQWLATNITSIFTPEQLIFLAPPANEGFIEWIRTMAFDGKQIITTDATLPMRSSRDIFNLDFKRINAGDPMENNEPQLLIADSRNVSVTRLTINKDLQLELVDYINNVINVHSTENIIVVTPNKNSREMLEHYIGQGLLPTSLQITYVRSNLTIGVKSDKRIMILTGAPFTPSGSHLADAFYQLDDFKSLDILKGLTHKQQIIKLAEELRAHAMAGAFYQTIGRAKDPLSIERSVVYCWGVRREIIEDMFNRIELNTVVPTIYDTYVRFDRTFHAWVGKYWKEKAIIVPPIIGKIIDYIITRDFESITTRQLWLRLNVSQLYGIDYNHFHQIIDQHKKLLVPFAIIQDKKTMSKKIIKKHKQKV